MIDILKICSAESCTACGACANVCPESCISFGENKYGEAHPAISLDLCIGCGCCVRVCPNNHELKFNWPIKCFAAKRIDVVKRRLSASGGIGAAIAEEMTAEGNRGVVYGTAYDNALTPCLQREEGSEALDKFKGSKYVQSVVPPGMLRRVKQDLEQGRKVAFFGTPCMVAGLKGFLGREYGNLLTVDLICHGVCPTKYLHEEIDDLRRRYRLDPVSDIRFRGNDELLFKSTLRDLLFGRRPKTNYALSAWTEKNGKSRMTYSGDAEHNYYLAGFLKSLSLRESCYQCHYSRPERISDITIGDYIGLGEKTKFQTCKSNISFVSVNTRRGLMFFEALLQNHEVEAEERPYEERLAYAPGLREPSIRHAARLLFLDCYREFGFCLAIRRVLSREFAARRNMRIKKFVLGLPRRVAKKICKVLG